MLKLTDFFLSSERFDVIAPDTFAVKGNMFFEGEKEFCIHKCLVFQLSDSVVWPEGGCWICGGLDINTTTIGNLEDFQCNQKVLSGIPYLY